MVDNNTIDTLQAKTDSLFEEIKKHKLAGELFLVLATLSIREMLEHQHGDRFTPKAYAVLQWHLFTQLDQVDYCEYLYCADEIKALDSKRGEFAWQQFLNKEQ